jgi:NADPH:quinone reductase-like Zn-dependent oxidoreductase
MKAIVFDRYGSADVLELKDIDKPMVNDDDVLVRVRAASANALDWHNMRGEPFIMRPQSGLRGPKRHVLGNDVAGEVEEVGKNVTRFRPGDEVIGDVNGSFAEYVCATKAPLGLKPAKLTFEQAAALPVAGVTALQGLRKHGRMQPGQKVLIIGASGGVGTFAVQIAKSFGAEVTGVCSTGNVELVRLLGADHVIDYTQEDFTRGQRRYDLIFQLAGTRSPSACRRALTSKGTLVLSSGESRGRWIGPTGRIIRGIVLSRFVSQKIVTFLAERSAEDLETLKELVDAGNVTPVIDRTYLLSEVPEAIRYLEEGHARGKIVITV